jgi:hypothetical protein
MIRRKETEGQRLRAPTEGLGEGGEINKNREGEQLPGRKTGSRSRNRVREGYSPSSSHALDASKKKQATFASIPTGRTPIAAMSYNERLSFGRTHSNARSAQQQFSFPLLSNKVVDSCRTFTVTTLAPSSLPPNPYLLTCLYFCVLSCVVSPFFFGQEILECMHELQIPLTSEELAEAPREAGHSWFKAGWRKDKGGRS